MAEATMHGLAATFAVTLALAIGCGGQSISSHDGADSGEAGSPTGGTSTGGASTTAGAPSIGGSTTAGGRAPTGGTPPMGGTADTGPVEECRLYARRYIQVSGGIESECDFDRPSLTLRCTAPDAETIVTWNTLDDVLRDNRPVGHFTFAKRTFDDGGCIFTETVAYDAAGRPEVSLAEAVSTGEWNCGLESFFYSAWDAEGRPTRALLRMAWSSPSILSCDDQEQTYTYDDEANQFVTNRSGGNGEACNVVVATTTFDNDGLLVKVAAVVDGSQLNGYDYTTLEVGTICRN